MYEAVLIVPPVLVPPLGTKTTVRPPVVRLLLLTSFAWRVNVTVPPGATVELETETVDVTAEATPGVTVIAGSVEVTAKLLIVA
jgi:hypothetical protein